jgi:hypothetical protein
METWKQSGDRSQALADMSKAKPRLEPLHEAKNITLSVARWIPSTAPRMADDEDLGLASSVLETELRAFLAIKLQVSKCLRDRIAAIDDQHRAGDEARQGRRKEEGSPRDLGWISPSFHRGSARDLSVPLWVVP